MRLTLFARAAALGLVVLASADPAPAAVFDTTLISRPTGEFTPGTGDSIGEIIVSANGRYVAWRDIGLFDPDTPNGGAVFVRDTWTGETTMPNRKDGKAGAP